MDKLLELYNSLGSMGQISEELEKDIQSTLSAVDSAASSVQSAANEAQSLISQVEGYLPSVIKWMTGFGIVIVVQMLIILIIALKLHKTQKTVEKLSEKHL